MPFINDPDELSQGGITSVAATTFAAGAGADQKVITSANVPAVTVGDYIEVRDADDPTNDGLWLVDAYSAGVSITATKQRLVGTVITPTTDAVSQTIRIFGTDADEKNIHFDTSDRAIGFINGKGSIVVLDDAGVLWQSFYSALKLFWKNDNDLIKFPFPVISITPEQFEFVSGWVPADEADGTLDTTPDSNTRQLLRTGGWDEVDVNGFITNQFFCWLTLGNIDASDFAYSFFDSADAAADIITATFDGAVNEGVQSIQRIDLTGAGTIAFVDGGGGNDQLTRTVGSWITDGVKVGDSIFIQNAEDTGNNGSFVVLAVTATDLDVATASFTANADDTTALVAIDRRANVFTCRIRVFGKTYDQSTTTDIGVISLTNQVYRFPLSEGADAVITDLATTETAGNIATLLSNITGGVTAPYNDMTVAYFGSDQTRSGFNPIGGDTPSPGDAQFGVIVDGDVSVPQEDGGGVASAEQIYAFVQARLQDTIDINDGAGAAVVTVIGQLAEPLLAIASTGNTLSSVLQTTNPGGATALGVYVDSFASTDKNRVRFPENATDIRSFPFVATGNIAFNANLSTDIDAIYRMFFTNDDTGDNAGFDFGTINAITVQNASAIDIAGAVPQSPGGSTQPFDFDYSGNVQRGAGSGGTDAPITLVALGLNVGQYVLATGTIVEAENQSFSLVAPLERNYANP